MFDVFFRILSTIPLILGLAFIWLGLQPLEFEVGDPIHVTYKANRYTKTKEYNSTYSEENKETDEETKIIYTISGLVVLVMGGRFFYQQNKDLLV